VGWKYERKVSEKRRGLNTVWDMFRQYFMFYSSGRNVL